MLLIHCGELLIYEVNYSFNLANKLLTVSFILNNEVWYLCVEDPLFVDMFSRTLTLSLTTSPILLRSCMHRNDEIFRVLLETKQRLNDNEWKGWGGSEAAVLWGRMHYEGSPCARGSVRGKAVAAALGWNEQTNEEGEIQYTPLRLGLILSLCAAMTACSQLH